MSTATNFQSCEEAGSHWWHGRSAMRVLLSAGIAAVGLYAVGDVVSGLLYDGYSHRDQAISELSAFGSPVRALMVAAILIHGVLLAAFGVGIWRSADRRSLRLTGLCIVAAGLIGFPTHTAFAMSSRWMETGFNDTMHITFSGIFSLFVAVAMVASAVAYRGQFRLYTTATLLVVIGFGAAASYAMRGLEENSTPWVGGFERINAYSYFAWIVALAVTLLRHHNSEQEPLKRPQRHTNSALWLGVAISIGAGVGAALGVVIAGGPGIAVGAAMGAGLGVVAGTTFSQSRSEDPQRR